MIKVGLTGNIGSGKSTAARIFETLGVPVYHADAEAKKMLSDPEVSADIRNHFGLEVFISGSVDRKALANLVFGDPRELEKLNSIIHPRVRQDLMAWIERHSDHDYVIQEAAILFESGFNTFFDKCIVVACPEDIAIKRVITRDRVSEKEVAERLKNQWPEGKKKALADYVINNDGSELIIPQILIIHNDLLKLSKDQRLN